MTDELYERARKRVQELKGLYVHLSVFIVVNAGLVALNVGQRDPAIWFPYVLASWGFGLAVHAISLVGGRLALGWEERKIASLVERELAKTERLGYPT